MSDASAAVSVNPQVDADFRPRGLLSRRSRRSRSCSGSGRSRRLLTRVPELLVPSAIGLPFGIPALRLFPLGETTTTNWLVDCAAALVMLAVVWMRLTDSARRNPDGGVGRAFWAGLGATVIGVLAGNLIRTVYLSFVLQEGPGAYLASLVGGALVSAVWGAIVGLFVGAVHALARRISRGTAAPDAGNGLPSTGESSIAEAATARP